MLLTRLYGTAVMAFHLRGQAAYPFKPIGTIKADQDRRVRETVAYAYQYVPYYRETMDGRRLRPCDFQSVDDLTRLPIVEREEITHDPQRFVSAAQPLDRFVRLRTSGSCGMPCSFYRDATSLYEEAAHSGRARAVLTPLIGKSFGYRKTMIQDPIGSSEVTLRFYREKVLVPEALGPYRQSLSVLDPPEVNAALINEFKPDAIHSFGSYLADLFAHVHEADIPLHRPKVVTFTSDGLPQSARRLIQDAFDIPAFSHYDAVEAPTIGFECEQHSGLHLNIDLCPVRIVDAAGKTLPIGESGDVVVSNLVNRGTVLLNYRLGDIATLMPEPCPCGRSLPLLSEVQGRNNDRFELPSGQSLHPQAVTNVFRYEKDIWQYQVVQETTAHVRVSLVAADTCNRQEASERLVANFAGTFGPDVRVEVHFVDSLARTPSGKVRPVVSLLHKPQPSA